MSSIEGSQVWKAATWAQSLAAPRQVMQQMMTQLESGWPIDNIGKYGERLLSEDVTDHHMFAALMQASSFFHHLDNPWLSQFLLEDEEISSLAELYSCKLYAKAEEEIEPDRRGKIRWTEILRRLWLAKIHVGFPSNWVLCLKHGELSNKIKVLPVSDFGTVAYIDVLPIECPPTRLRLVDQPETTH